MGEVDDAENAEDQRQTARDQEQQQPVLQGVEALDEKDCKIHRERPGGRVMRRIRSRSRPRAAFDFATTPAKGRPEPAAETSTAQSIVRPQVAKLCAARITSCSPGDGSASALTATPSNLFCVPTTLRR